MLSDSLLNNVGNMLQTRRQLFRPVIAERNIICNITLIPGDIQSLLELGPCLVKFAFFEKHAALRHNGFGGVDGHLLDERLGRHDLFQLVLDTDLQLQDLVFEVPALDLLQHLQSIGVHAGLVKRLSVVQLVRVPSVTITEELRQLVVAVGGTAIILYLELAVPEQRQGSAVARRELELGREDGDHLGVLLISDQTVYGLRILAVGNGPELIIHNVNLNIDFKIVSNLKPILNSNFHFQLAKLFSSSFWT